MRDEGGAQAVPPDTLKRKEHAAGDDAGGVKRTRNDGGVAGRSSSTAGDAAVPPGSLDAEWAEFQRTVLSADVTAADAETAAAEPAKTYEHATISAEPSLMRDEPPPPPEEERAPVETEEQKRSRVDREMREEILARLDSEQQVQREGDERVHVLRQRLSRIREARKKRAQDT
ncbi:hypothetical protein MSPP1_002248 [Malassezia sp. CBS 17886]|nr:hypothetical protein MSPP1_002248 [Malassezia sp. CBS 17886]